MKKKYLRNNLSEEIIINKYLNKLNFNKKGTFNFKNDASYIKLKKSSKIVITTDSISESLDFFKKDNPKSIANKIVTINISDLYAMGASPYAYNLSLFFPKYIDFKWIKIFTKELLKLQKKYNFYLLGGDLSKSDKLIITSTFFGFTQQNKIITQNKVYLNNDIWITGNIGDSYIGFQILSNKINIRNSKIKKYFLNKYYFPKACKIDSEIFKYVKSITDISDGFIGDLKKMLDNKYGAKLNLDKIPFSNFLKKLISENKISNKLILNSGDNYELIIISDKKYRNKIINISKKSKLKITRVGVVSKKIQILDDSNNILNMPREYDHFL